MSCHQLPFATGGDYKSGGAKKSQHGYDFQKCLLMLSALRAYNLKYPDFKLGTEVADAGKLDDIVFSYGKGEKEGDGRYFRLVQAKHTLRKQKETLRARQLFEDPNKDFSLRMYFNAYRKLMQGGKLLGKCDAIQDLILCTNMNFISADRFEDFVIDELTFVTESNGEDGKDRILRNKLMRFSESFGGRETLVLHLKNCVVGIPSNFAACVISGTECSWDEGTADTETPLCELYENVLWDEVVDVKTLRFKESFCSCRNLSKPALHFRYELFSKFMASQDIEGERDEISFCKFLEETMLHESLQELSVRGVHLDCPKKLAKKLSETLRKNRNTGVIKELSKESVVWQNLKSLMKFVLIERDGKSKFREEFLHGDSLPGNLSEFREILEKNIGYFELRLRDLENYTFEIESSVSATDLGDALDADVCEFLRILRFSVNQPGIKEMEELILDEIKVHFKGVELMNACDRFYRKMSSWAGSEDGKYLTNEDIKRFFGELQKEFLGSRRFKLIAPVDWDWENFVRLSEDDTDVLFTKNYVGISLMKIGKYSEALDLFMDVLKMGRSTLGEDSKLLFSAKSHIGDAFGLMGDDKESWKYMEACNQQSQKIVDEYKFFSGQVLPNEEENVVEREDREGAFHRRKGLLQHDLRVGKLKFDLDVDIFIQAILNISTVHAMTGNFEESIREAEKAYELLSVLLGEKHFKRVTVRNMMQMSKYSVALDSHMNILKSEQTMVEEDSARLSFVKANISNAFRLLREGVGPWEIIGGCYRLLPQEILDKWIYFSSKDTVFEKEATEGAFQKDKELLQHDLRVGKRNYDLNVVEFIYAIVEISLAFRENFEEFIGKAERVYELFILLLGEKHFKRVSVRSMVAVYLCKIGNANIAFRLLRESNDIQS